MKRALTFFMAGFSLLLSGACARPAGTLPAEAAAIASAPTTTSISVFRESGTAMWYGREMDGRQTADGSVFDMNGMSAAHRTLPLGTVVRITNLDNGNSSTVTVTDRGPFISDRIVALSYGAARALGFVAQGTAKVRIEAEGPVPEEGRWTVLAATFAEEENAKVLRYRLSRRYRLITIDHFENNIGTFYRVLVGSYSSGETAERIAAKLVREGLEPLVMRQDR